MTPFLGFFNQLQTGKGEGYAVEYILFFQQLFVPFPSHKRSTPGSGNPGGGTEPLFTSKLSVIFAPSALGSMSPKASGGSPAKDPKMTVLTVAMPVKLLFRTLLFLMVALSTPTKRTPEPLGTKASKPPEGSAKFT